MHDQLEHQPEVVMCLLSWKICYPNHFFMSRGNHETKNLNKLYGFEEVTLRKGATTTLSEPGPAL
jgi:hypothetical protein